MAIVEKRASFHIIEETTYGDLLDVNPFQKSEVNNLETPDRPIVATAANSVHEKYLKHLLNRLDMLAMEKIVYDLGGLGYGIGFKGTVSSKPYRNIPCKPAIIQDALKRINSNECLLWLDADTLPSAALDLVRHDYDLCLSIRRYKSPKPQEGWINAGVIILRNTEATNQFLSLWSKISKILKGDQHAINLIIHEKKFRKNVPKFLRRMKITGLPTDIINNFYTDDSVKNAIIRHYKTDIRHLHPAHQKTENA
jgi:hypothetical protein